MGTFVKKSKLPEGEGTVKKFKTIYELEIEYMEAGLPAMIGSIKGRKCHVVPRRTPDGEYRYFLFLATADGGSDDSTDNGDKNDYTADPDGNDVVSMLSNCP